MVPTLRVTIICESYVGANENIIFDRDSIPDLNARLYGHPIADDDVIFDEAVSADVAVFSDDRTFEDDAELPYPCPSANTLCLDIGERMNKSRLQNLCSLDLPRSRTRQPVTIDVISDSAKLPFNICLV